MTTTLKKMSALVLASAVTFSMLSSQALANGAIGDHVNNLHAQYRRIYGRGTLVRKQVWQCC